MSERATITELPIVLYGDQTWDSPYVFTVYVALKEKGVSFDVRTLDLTRGEQRSARYQERSITARVPCIEHNGFMLSESLAIIEYLDDCFDSPAFPPLLPYGTLARARARQLLGWLRSDLLPLRDERPTTTMFFARATPGGTAPVLRGGAVLPLGEKAQAAADKLIRVAEQLVPQGEGELFDTWSSADADLAFMLHRLILNGDPVPDRIARYAARQWSRPSVKAYVDHERGPQR